ncbi:ABC transporter substrate-binding protein [Corynebacterium diphtheriae]|uniref:ABC transporter substrate-binding protein n=1 Tax=Corynebacterium diphtheriae TaxID=1717 RepID=UPI000929C614|nr:iron-siderophore ABC transporter substrate-binding protein [Corynebacterium diphtheriae]OJH98858.1 ABC transporter substrate-binding protein [Corynebacterium diphtheriae]
MVNRRTFLQLAALSTAGFLAACAADTAETAGDAEEQRVVALNTGQLDNLLTLGILPVGAAKAKGAGVVPQFIRDAFEGEFDLDSIADCGVRATPELETIAALKPTLICANSRTDEAVLKQLRAIASVVIGKGGGENWKEDLLTIAKAVGKEDRAQELLGQYEQDAKDFGASLPEVPTVGFLRSKGDQFQVYGTASMAGTVAQDAGLKRPVSQQNFKKAGQDISAEELSMADAEWLFYGVQDGAADPTTVAAWPTLEAVQNNQAVKVDYEAWFLNASLLSATIILDGFKEHLV